MRKPYLGKKLFSALLSLSILIGALFALPVSAADGDSSVTGPTITPTQESYGAKAYSLTDEQIAGAGWWPDNTAYKTKYPYFNNNGNSVSYTMPNSTTAQKDAAGNVNIARLNDGIVSNANYCTGSADDGGALFKVLTESAPLTFQINLGNDNSECASILLCWRNFAPTSYTVYATATRAGFTPSDANKILTVENETETDCNRLITFDTRQKLGRIIITFNGFASTVETDDGAVPALLLTELAVYNRAYSANIEVADDYGAFSESASCWTVPDTLLAGNQVFGGGNAYLIDDSTIGVDENGEAKKYTVYIHCSSTDGNIFQKFGYKDLSGKRLIVLADGWYLGVSNGVKVYQYTGQFVLGSGDINGDSYVDASDLILMRKTLLGAAGFDKAFTDINGDRSVDILDLVKLKKKV